ncbi:hypothetical protein ACFP8W_10265, partial [Nocardioides hankookensis]
MLGLLIALEDPWGPAFDDGSADPGIPGWFVVLFVLVLVAGVATTIWRVSTAQRMARDSGMDEGDAATMALLSDDGLEATYLASNLRTPPAEPATPSAPAT